jgi:hypothetical protein
MVLYEFGGAPGQEGRGQALRMVEALGPSSGWGIPHKPSLRAKPDRSTPYLVTRRGMAHARQWLYWVGVLQRLIARAKAMMLRVITPYPTEVLERQKNSENSAPRKDSKAELDRFWEAQRSKYGVERPGQEV